MAKAGLDLSFDEAMDKAGKLLTSPKASDQLLGQKIVDAAIKKFRSDVQTLQKRGEDAAKAIGSAVRGRRPATLAAARVKVAGGQRATVRLKLAPKQRSILTALRKAGIRSITLRLQVARCAAAARRPSRRGRR